MAVAVAAAIVPGVVDARRQAVDGSEELLPRQRGRDVQDVLQRAASGSRPQKTLAVQSRAASAQVTLAAAAHSRRGHQRLELPAQHLPHGRLSLVAGALLQQRQQEALGGAERGLGRGRAAALAFALLRGFGRRHVATKH